MRFRVRARTADTLSARRLSTWVYALPQAVTDDSQAPSIRRARRATRSLWALLIAAQEKSPASWERIQAQDFFASFHAAIWRLVPRGSPFLL